MGLLLLFRSTTIKIGNCGSYYIYFLDGRDDPKGCSPRYCGPTDLKYEPKRKECFYTILNKCNTSN